MKKTIRNLCALAMAALFALPGMAQLNGSGYYRVYNVQYQTHYLSIANDLFNYLTCISTAGGGLTQVALFGGDARALECAGKYLQTDIHMIDDQDFTHPSAVIYADKYLPNQASNHKYNLIGQGTSILTLTTGTYDGNADLIFKDIYVTIDPVSGTTNQYTANVVLKASNSSSANLGTRYFVDNNGTFAIGSSSSASNAKWVIVPVTHFNVVPDVEFNGKYYTTLKVPFACQLSGSVEKAYVITATSDGILTPQVIAVTGETIPAGTPVILQCGSANAADCQLIPTGTPRFTAPDQNNTNTNSPRADNGTDYTGANLLQGTYYDNTDGSITFTTKSGTSSFNANNNTSSTNPQKYVIGVTSAGKLGYVNATASVMPANKAWLTVAGVFPTVATPVISPASGTYTAAQNVTITAEEGATIEYSTDGGATWQTYADDITVNETTTIQARATKPGLYNNSAVASATIEISVPDPVLTVNPTTLTINDMGGNFTVSGTDLGTDDVGVTSSVFSTTTDDQSWGFLNNNGTVDGTVTVTYEGRELSANGTVNVANNIISNQVEVTYKTDIFIVTDNGVTGQWNFGKGKQMDYEDGIYTVKFTTTAPNTYILFARKLGEGVTWNTRYVFGPSSDGDWVMPNQATEGGIIDIYDDDPIKLPYAGEYTITINGESKAFTIIRTIETVATPTFTPEAGTYDSAQTVEIACATEGAQISYKIDGGEYQDYNGSIEVTKSCTITAIATKDGWNASEEAIAEYVIEIPEPIMLGDIDGNGEVDINDVTAYIDHLLDSSAMPFVSQNADLDGNNDYDINDVTMLIDMLLNDGSK